MVESLYFQGITFCNLECHTRNLNGMYILARQRDSLFAQDVHTNTGIAFNPEILPCLWLQGLWKQTKTSTCNFITSKFPILLVTVSPNSLNYTHRILKHTLQCTDTSILSSNVFGFSSISVKLLIPKIMEYDFITLCVTCVSSVIYVSSLSCLFLDRGKKVVVLPSATDS